MKSNIVHKKEYEEIQLAAEKVQERYYEVLKKHPNMNPVFGEPTLNKFTEELVKLIVNYPSGEFKGNESMYRTFVYITKTIPIYTGVDKKGKTQKFFTLFRTYYNNDYEKIGLTECEDVDWNTYGRNEFNRLNEDKACKKIKSYMSILKNKGIEINGESDTSLDQMVEIILDEEYAGGHSDEFVAKRRREIKHYLNIIFKYGYIKYYNPSDVSSYGEVLDADFKSDDVDLVDKLDNDVEETVGFFKLLARFSSNYINKTNRERIKCLFTNEVATGFRDYVEEGVDDLDDEEDEKQWKLTRALSLEDSFMGCREEMYESLLHLGYLKYVLQDNTPNSLERISGVCLDEFQIQNGKQKKFIPESIARHLNVDKGTISVLKNHTYEALKRDLMEWYGFE